MLDVMTDRRIPLRSRDHTKAFQMPAPSLIMALAAGLGIIALFARIMAYPLQHDEHFYIPASVLFSFSGLYSDLGFSHFPNLPLLLHTVFGILGTDHYLLVGRLLIFACWLATAAAVALLGRYFTHDTLMPALMVVLLVTNPLLLGATGMAVTNNFIPIPFALFGLLCFLTGLDDIRPASRLMALSGFLLAVAAGFKANYVALVPPFVVAVLLLPRAFTFPQRLTRVVLPFLLGGVIGGAPTLLFLLNDPAGFFVHSFSFHRGPQIAFWQASADPVDPKVIDLRAKALLAQQIWFTGTTMVLAVSITFLIVLNFLQAKAKSSTGSGIDWRTTLVVAVVLAAGLMSFMPTPAFPQYYALPIPFAIALLGVMYGTLRPAGRIMAHPFLIAALGLSIIVGAPMLLLSLPGLLTPQDWTAIRVHADGRRLANFVHQGGTDDSRIATLAPVYALEGGATVYPHLALGPFVYRVGDHVPWQERHHFNYLASPRTIDMVLDAFPPNGVLVGFEDPALEQPFVRFAERKGYRPLLIRLGHMSTPAILFIRPAVNSADAPPPA